MPTTRKGEERGGQSRARISERSVHEAGCLLANAMSDGLSFNLHSPTSTSTSTGQGNTAISCTYIHTYTSPPINCSPTNLTAISELLAHPQHDDAHPYHQRPPPLHCTQQYQTTTTGSSPSSFSLPSSFLKEKQKKHFKKVQYLN
jgi:hypothetical protein